MKIKIKGVSYKIKFVNLIDGSEDILGQTRYEDKLILIKLGLGSKVIETISHELYHATLYECGLKNEAWDEELISWFSHHYKEIGLNLVSLMKLYNKGFDIEFKRLFKNYNK